MTEKIKRRKFLKEAGLAAIGACAVSCQPTPDYSLNPPLRPLDEEPRAIVVHKSGSPTEQPPTKAPFLLKPTSTASFAFIPTLPEVVSSPIPTPQTAPTVDSFERKILNLKNENVVVAKVTVEEIQQAFKKGELKELGDIAKIDILVDQASKKAISALILRSKKKNPTALKLPVASSLRVNGYQLDFNNEYQVAWGLSLHQSQESLVVYNPVILASEVPFEMKAGVIARVTLEVLTLGQTEKAVILLKSKDGKWHFYQDLTQQLASFSFGEANQKWHNLTDEEKQTVWPFVIRAALPQFNSLNEVVRQPILKGIVHPLVKWSPLNNQYPLPKSAILVENDPAQESRWILTPRGDFQMPVVSLPPTQDKWIDVDLGQQRMAAYFGSEPVFGSLISTGRLATPTPKGTFEIFTKNSIQTMDGRPLGFDYVLPNVPWNMYFKTHYALHGTFWHDEFGTPQSHGCVNLPTPEAGWLFEWAPIGTLVKVHD